MEIWEQEDKRPTLVAAASIRRPPAGRIKTIATRTLRFKKNDHYIRSFTVTAVTAVFRSASESSNHIRAIRS